MNFGDKLKNLRADAGWTQPEAAEAIGVEQSYLSKLENGHSTPSGDVFARIVKAYEIGVAEMLSGLDHSAKSQLRQIADVDDHLSTQTRAEARRARLSAIAYNVCMALGAALIYAGTVNLFFPDREYGYRSKGVVLDGEPFDFFQRPPAHLRTAEALDDYRGVVHERWDEVFIWTVEDRGKQYIESVDGGRRSFDRVQARPVNEGKNGLVTFAGVFALTLGFIGLLIQAALGRKRS